MRAGDGFAGGVRRKFQMAGTVVALAFNKIAIGHFSVRMRETKRNQKFVLSVSFTNNLKL